jgi:Lrp/AsnC family leucine-responsive transcriptional regulator
MSIPAVTDRIKKLQESGIIMGFTAVLNHRKVGLDVSAFITVISESSSHYSDVVRETNNTPEIVQCFTTTGNGSHVLLALTENTHSLEKLLRTIQSWPGVMRTETQIILSSYKGINAVHIP